MRHQWEIERRKTADEKRGSLTSREKKVAEHFWIWAKKINSSHAEGGAQAIDSGKLSGKRDLTGGP